MPSLSGKSVTTFQIVLSFMHLDFKKHRKSKWLKRFFLCNIKTKPEHSGAINISNVVQKRLFNKIEAFWSCLLP